ncbi:hypothetical protein FRC02_005457 [Tulasnella sp. 418]|nr:hypothetical protein FRC02_005457 [Tulasnella sp. 418]
MRYRPQSLLTNLLPPHSPTPATPPQSYGVQKSDALASTPTSVVTEEKLPKKHPVDVGADTLPPAKCPLLSVEQSPQTPSLPAGPSGLQTKHQRTVSHESQLSDASLPPRSSGLRTKHQQTVSYKSQMSDANSNQTNVSTRSSRQCKLTEKAGNLVDQDGNWLEECVASVRSKKDS